MNRTSWSRGLSVAGLCGMLLGALDPLEGCVVILGGSVLAAAAAYLGQSRRRRWLYAALAMIAVGVAAMFALTAVGGVGGRSGHSKWWALTILPYPAGWILGVVAAVIIIREYFKRPSPASTAA